jgi:hypothetical protein
MKWAAGRDNTGGPDPLQTKTLPLRWPRFRGAAASCRTVDVLTLRSSTGRLAAPTSIHSDFERQPAFG